MRYRALSPDGDYTFGAGRQNFLVDSPECVGQAVETRLRLLRGEWFLDTREGTPYATDILGKNNQPTYDAAIRDRILGTEGVTGIVSYSSELLPSRKLRVEARIDTQFGQTPISQVL